MSSLDGTHSYTKILAQIVCCRGSKQLPFTKNAPAGKAPRFPRKFGLDDTPACMRCDAPTQLVRRVPHPALGAAYELQTFACTSCEHVQSRGADENGALRPAACA